MSDPDPPPDSDTPDVETEPAAAASGFLRRARGAFQYPDYRLLWVIHLSHEIVMGMRILVIAQWLLDTTGSAAILGLIGVVQLVVQIPALLFGGTLADHLDRKRLMIMSGGTTVALFLVLAMMDAAGVLAVWHVFLALGIASATHVIGTPARAALVPLVVPPRHVMLAVSTDTATQNVARVVGPLIFAGAAVVFGLTGALLATALVGIPSTLVPLLVRVRGRAEGTTDGSTIRRTIDGFIYIVKHPILPGLFLLDTGITVVSFYRDILPALARNLFRGGAGASGVLGSANAAGAIIGSFIALFLSGYRAKGMLVLYATLAYAIILFGFGSVTTLWMGAIMIAGLGGSDAVTVAVRQSTVHLTTPDHMRGRAYAFLILAAQTANNIGTIWVGFWAGAIGAGNTMILGGAISLVATLVIWRVWRPIREYRSP